MTGSVLLIATGRSSFGGALWGAYDLDLPLPLAYAVASLEAAGVDVTVVDLQLSADADLQLEGLLRRPWALVGLSANLSGARGLYDAARRCKLRHPDTPVIALGHAAVLRELLLEECEFVDGVLHGDEEPALLAVVAAIQAGTTMAGIPGVIRRDGGAVIREPRARVADLDALPFPARHRFEVQRYFPSPGKYRRRPQLTMLSSRGCDHHCLFCPRPGGAPIRVRSADDVVAEIEEVQERFGAREIYFLDDTFTADRDRTLELAERLARRRQRPLLRIASRVDCVDEELLRALAAAGVYSVGYGIESGDDRILEQNKKGFTLAQAEEALRLTKRLGLETRGFFMLNLPGDTRQTTERTMEAIARLPLDLVNVQITYPYPNTPLRSYVRDRYRTDPDRWRDWSCSGGDEVVFTQGDLSRDDVLESYRTILRRFYLTPRFMLYWAGRLRSLHDLKYSMLQAWALGRRTMRGLARGRR